MTAKNGRWKSRRVDLRVLGTAGSLVTLLAGCSNAKFERNVYKSETDCGLDYALSVCTQQGMRQADRFLGPAYRVVNGRPSACNSRDPGAGPLSTRRLGVEPSLRGGFGCSRRSGWSSSNRNNNSSYRWSSGG
ncbi:MAG: hypothetical protein ACKVP7_29195 [Hyphomicrobiaceae bacterium]